MKYFDVNGWLSDVVIEGRHTDVPVPDETLKEGYGWNFTGIQWIQHKLVPDEAEQIVVEIPREDRKITKLAFLNRFTDEEAIKLDLASIGATVQAAAIRRYLQKVNVATFIDLNREDLISGVKQLELSGIIAAGRAKEIIDNPISDEEKFKG